MISKTIIIQSQTENKQGKGILTLYQEDDLLKCKIRLYQMPKLFDDCMIGVYHNKQVYSANLIERDGVYHSSLVGDFDMRGDFFVALIEPSENKIIMSGGTKQANIGLAFDTLLEPTQQAKSEVQEQCVGDCSNCKYKQFFYANKESEQPSESVAEQQTQQMVDNSPTQTHEQVADLLSQILPQFDYIFENYQKDTTLNSLLPNGRFVCMAEDGESFSLGVIEQDEQIKYLCYAQKANYNQPAPTCLGEHYQWLPIDALDPLSDGYYVVFQDAKDLHIVEL